VPTYDSLVTALEGLKSRGFTEEFSIIGGYIECGELNLRLYPDDFEVKEVFRFEGMSNPDDSTVLYAIESDDGVKGTFVVPYGAYVDGDAAQFIRSLRTKQQD
jgi:hypothetical protein